MRKSKLFEYVLFLLLTCMLAACSGVKVSQDYVQGYNFTRLKTFAWKPNDNNEYGLRDNALVDKRIRTAIENQLTARSYVLTSSGVPDFYVSYKVTVEQKLSNSGVSSGVTLGRSSAGGFGGVSLSTGSRVSSYDQGTLLIDFTEPLEDQLIWRGVSTQAIDDHLDPEESTVIINETVAKMLDQFPPQ